MITKEQESNKYCCLYVSDYHLEMILLPFIKNKMQNSEILIFTQKNLLESIKVLIKKTNLNSEIKSKILKIRNWDNSIVNRLNKKSKKKYTVIINGDEKFRKDINQEIKSLNTNNICIVDCYDINECKIQGYEIRKNYKGVLNTESI